jgi:hypothetical protein
MVIAREVPVNALFDDFRLLGSFVLHSSVANETCRQFPDSGKAHLEPGPPGRVLAGPPLSVIVTAPSSFGCKLENHRPTGSSSTGA